MIHFSFTLMNPFKAKDREQKDYFCKDWSLTKNKFLEIQVSRWTMNDIVSVSLDTRWYGQDHGGVRLNLELFGFMFCAQLYDNRHWDYDNHKWEDPNDNQEQD